MTQASDPEDDASGEQILLAVRAAIAAEVERVDHPGPRSWDSDGWHAYAPLAEIPAAPEDAPGETGVAPGHPVHEPEAWRWFQLVDLAYLPALVLVEFTWSDPQTPDLHYVTALNVPTSDADLAASVARSSLRGRLAPGWRQRVQCTWLGSDRVMIGGSPRSARVEQSLARMREEIWNQPRPSS